MQYRRPSSSIAAAAVVLLTATVAMAAGWEKADSEDGVNLYTKDLPNSGIDALKADMTLPYTTDQVAELLTDLKEIRNYSPAVKATKLLNEKTLDNGHHVMLTHQVTHIPAFDDRDVVLRSETWSEKTDKGTVWKSTFKSVTGVGPAEDPDMVRMPALDGAWTLTPTKNGTATRFVYIMHTEIGGNLPDFLVQSGQNDALLDMMIRIGKRCDERFGSP